MRIYLVLIVLPLLAACGSETPEERLEAAGARLESTEDNLEAVEARIEELETSLAAAKERRRALRERVLTLEEQVAARATDVALFRAVQSALLELPGLTEAAVSVEADGGTIALSGLVASPAEREAAETLAAATPGVDRVINRISVQPPAGQTP